MLIGFEHIGTTSRDLDRTIEFYCDLLGFRLVLRKPQASGELAFLNAGGGMLEVFAPATAITPARDVPPGEGGEGLGHAVEQHLEATDPEVGARAEAANRDALVE